MLIARSPKPLKPSRTRSLIASLPGGITTNRLPSKVILRLEPGAMEAPDRRRPMATLSSRRADEPKRLVSLTRTVRPPMWGVTISRSV